MKRSDTAPATGSRVTTQLCTKSASKAASNTMTSSPWRRSSTAAVRRSRARRSKRRESFPRSLGVASICWRSGAEPSRASGTRRENSGLVSVTATLPSHQETGRAPGHPGKRRSPPRSKPPETLTTKGFRLKAVWQKWARSRLAATENRLRDPMFHRRAILIRHRFSIFTVISGMALVAGCATSVEQRGNLPAQDKIAEVHPGSTTKDEVIKILGSPSSVSIFNDKSWYYISRRTEQFSFFDPDVVDQQVYVVNFDNQDVVKAVDHKGLEDGKEIIPVARATPAPGRELSFLEQLIGNLGKFNSPAGGSSGGGSTTDTHKTGRPDS